MVITWTLRLIKQPRLNLVIVTVCNPKYWGVEYVQVACSRKLASNWNKMAHFVHAAIQHKHLGHIFFRDIFGWMHEASVGPILPHAWLNMSIIHINCEFYKNFEIHLKFHNFLTFTNFYSSVQFLVFVFSWDARTLHLGCRAYSCRIYVVLVSVQLLVLVFF